MAKVNMTRFAILGVLSLYPASGYDIKRFCDAGVAHFWHENYGHLYPVLHQLEGENLIEQVKKTDMPAEPATGRNRILYRITEHGRAALGQWLTEPVQPAPLRLELLLKMTFAGRDEQDFMISELQRLRQGHQKRRILMQKVLTQLENNPEAQKWSGFPYWVATARYGLQDADFRINWYAEAGERIRTWFSPDRTAADAADEPSAGLAGVYPTTGQDWINQIADDGSSWSILQAGLRLDQPLDLPRFRRAARQLLDDEPVLGCRFDDACEPPVWRSLDLPDECWCALLISRTPDETIKRLIADPLPDSGQSWQAQVVRSLDASGQATDYLLIRAHHALVDAAGLRDLIVRLAGRYRQQASGQPEELPRLGSRSMLPLFATVGSPDPRRLFRPDLAALQAGWGLPGAARDAIPEIGDRPVYTIRTLNEKQSGSWLQAAHKTGVTLTALLLAGLGQTLEESLEPEQETVRLIQVTSNLRRYLPPEQALILGNLSGMLPIRLPAGESAFADKTIRLPAGESAFAEQLRQLGEQLKAQQDQRADLHSAALLQLLSTRSYADVRNLLAAAWQKSKQSQHAAPILSNLGRWPEETLIFDEKAVSDVCFYGPAMHAPAVLLAVIGYQGRISLSVGHFPGERPAGTVEKLLESLIQNIDRQAETVVCASQAIE